MSIQIYIFFKKKLQMIEVFNLVMIVKYWISQKIKQLTCKPLRLSLNDVFHITFEDVRSIRNHTKPREPLPPATPF